MQLYSSAAICFFYLLFASAQSYWSPDHAIQAYVRQTGIEFRASSGHTMLRDDAPLIVAHAAWTPDSQFFVAGAENPDGHQPWAHPIRIYSRAKNRILDLSAFGATAVADFSLKSPDVLLTQALDCKGSKSAALSSRPLAIHLHDLIAAGRLPDPPCSAP